MNGELDTLGSLPFTVNLGWGNPVNTTAKVPCLPGVNTAVEGDVNAGSWITCNTNCCVALGARPLAPTMVRS